MVLKYSKIDKMLIIYNNNKSNTKFIIDWSPKAGCTTVCKIFFDYMDLLNQYLLKDEWIHNHRPDFYKKYGKVNHRLLLNKKYIKIKFVRNPYSRAISSYIHIMKTHLKKSIFNNIDMSFYDFLLKISKKNIKNNIHYDLQINIFENNNIYNNNYIIKIENINQEIKNLNKIYNIQLSSNFTSNHHIFKNNDIIEDFSLIKFSEFKNNIPNYKSFYLNNNTKLLVEKLYYKDLHTYNYSFIDFLNEYS